ncbi:MAG: DNA-binding response regulator, partial [Saprospiraceae bacterium]
DTVIKMVQAGARGYILKDGPLEEIVLAIKSLAGGNSYFSREISSTIIAKLGSNSPRRRLKTNGGASSLTRRELEILEYISKEFTNKEIAGELYISPRTVETHRRNLMQKLKVKNSVGLVIYYFNKIQGRGVAMNA